MRLGSWVGRTAKILTPRVLLRSSKFFFSLKASGTSPSYDSKPFAAFLGFSQSFQVADPYSEPNNLIDLEGSPGSVRLELWHGVERASEENGQRIL